MNTPFKSGHIWLADGKVHYESQDYGSWSFPATDLRIFGEHTNDHGPMLDDWFMIFVTSAERGWYEASIYANCADEFRKQLGGFIGADDLHCELAASAGYASRIIWPQTLRGQPLFDFTPIPVPWWRRLLRFGGGQLRMELLPRVREYAHNVA